MQQFVIEPEVRNNHSYGKGHNDGDQKRFYRNEVNGSRFENLFVMPTKRSLNCCFWEEIYINEATHRFNLWINNTQYESVAQKTVHVMPALLLQKPSKFSKSNEQLEALSRWLSLWDEGRIDELLHEDRTIQDCLKSSKTQSRQVLMNKRNVSGTLKLLTNSMSNGILLLSNKTLDFLEQKHTEPLKCYP